MPLEGGSSAFDPSPLPLHPDDYTLPKAAHVLGSMLLEAAGMCHTPCQARTPNCMSSVYTAAQLLLGLPTLRGRAVRAETHCVHASEGSENGGLPAGHSCFCAPLLTLCQCVGRAVVLGKPLCP